MLIRIPKDWELPESAVTPERDYMLRPRVSTLRRDFLKTLGYGAAGLAGAALTSNKLLATTTGFPTTMNPAYRDPALKPTAYELITSYNNFYEFGTDKAEPRINANKGWKSEPWT